MRVLVHGFAITGVSTVRALLRRGHDVVVTDDTVTEQRAALATELGVDLGHLPSGQSDAGDALDEFVAGFDVVSPAPGVPERHRLFAAAARVGVPLWSEIEIAYRWEQERPGGPRPILAITGTDGKTTTTDLTVAILRAAGLRTEALGNTDVPLLDAVDSDLDVFVVECTSFRLATTERFRADGAVWLNLAPDHLNWHASMNTYEAAKARIFGLQRPDDVAIGFGADPAVMRHLTAAPSRQRTFGLSGADYFLDGDMLTGPNGPIIRTLAMKRSLPHDITNALAASALVLETGLADVGAIQRALSDFVAQPHRLEYVAEIDGVRWYNDSKATTPHAASTAIRSFDSLVLIAGGSRKGVDLSPMATEPFRVRTVIAIGEAAPDVREIFASTTTVVDATSMAEAVDLAAAAARPGDAVVLSPGCASFDWYIGYPHRGDHFRQLVHERRATNESLESNG